MKMPRESYTIPERPADPPAMRPAAYRPMPPGYQGTVPLLPEETRQAIRDAFAAVNLPPGSILRLPPPDPAYQSLRPGTGIWPSTAAFLIACMLGGSLFVLWRAGVFR